MLLGFFFLLLAQLIGEAIAHGLALPVPGPVIGIILSVIAITWRDRVMAQDDTATDAALGSAADALLKHMGLLFVPAGVGVVQQLGLLADNSLAVIVAIAGSTILTMLATVATFRLVSGLVGRRHAGENG
jgi:holin-like protein